MAILDVMLPGCNGWEVVQTIRRAGKTLPIIFLTARDQVDDRVNGLELGADDYLIKPFSFSELLARIRTRLRRGAGAEFERLSRMISEMLFLAKADHGLISPSYEAVDLAAEVDRLIEFYDAYAEENAVILLRVGGENIVSDRLMIQRALSNLLSNAIRHTPRGGTVTLTIERPDNTGIRITVENPGEAISAHHLPHLFDRFYRVDPSRERSSEGAGLGLAITHSIVETLGGNISVESQNGKTKFIVVLPAAAGAAITTRTPADHSRPTTAR